MNLQLSASDNHEKIQTRRGREEVQELDLFAKAKGKYGVKSAPDGEDAREMLRPTRAITPVSCLNGKTITGIQRYIRKDGERPRALRALSPREAAPGIADDQVYVADWGNNRIQVFDLPIIHFKGSRGLLDHVPGAAQARRKTIQ